MFFLPLGEETVGDPVLQKGSNLERGEVEEGLIFHMGRGTSSGCRVHLFVLPDEDISREDFHSILILLFFNLSSISSFFYVQIFINPIPAG